MSIQNHRWIAKALAQKAVTKLGLLRAYHRGQQLGGQLKNFHPRSRMEYPAKIALDIGLGKLLDADVVEIGTGWVPAVPIGLSLLGARSVTSFDLSRHLQPGLTMKMLGVVQECLADMSSRCGEAVPKMTTRLTRLQRSGSMESLATAMRFAYHAPADFRKSGITTGSVDVVYSNLVLEHVEAGALKGILEESRRILKPGGTCWHNVDYTDHYAHTHKGLSQVNFLRYGDRFWDRVGQNDILYQNRMRQSDYVRAFEAAGFEIASVVDHPIDGKPSVVPLHPKFASYAPKDIACGSSRFVLRKRA